MKGQFFTGQSVLCIRSSDYPDKFPGIVGEKYKVRKYSGFGGISLVGEEDVYCITGRFVLCKTDLPPLEDLL